ncbi:putative uncharacterized protein [Waddlia chondrophila 2032/99]|uniref:Uncharacterized protein n=2 Tax=Waddlia chondrophila TaxID=71667 RepID=D6YX03_WADCW|nr:hypothetical protein [Waddlia chondrophila]ADI38664.1 conserved hypothetical protein [Waddlia chondrophila WSU 86-1044]CCB90897.1 putative uncharacterized protein [Waddlia chondrophila 2032/99]
MSFILSNIQAFSQALKNVPVICTFEGYWSSISPAVQQAQAMIGVDKHRLIKIAKVFAQCLDDLEKVPTSSGKTQEDLLACVDAAETIQLALEKTKSKRAVRWSRQLKSRVVAFQTRNQLSEKMAPGKELVDKVNALASEWKKNSHVREREGLDTLDIARLKKIEDNGAFIEQLTVDTDLRNRFFNWVLRDRIDPEPFIEFPATCQRLTQARLAHRIGFYGGGDLKVKDVEMPEGEMRRDLTLPMGEKEVSLLDDRLVVHLEKEYELTVGQVFEMFVNRQWEIGNIEYFKDGISNWNPKHLGPYDPNTKKYEQIDFAKESWWEHLPVVEELPVEEASRRYGLPLDGNQWAMVVRAAREQEDDTPIGVHGWLQVAIPINGKYRIFDFGKYSQEFPKTWYEYIDMTVNTVPAAIVYPDEAAFSMDRQHIWHAVMATAEEGQKLLSSIQGDVERAEDRNLAFQFLADNCVKWAWTKANEAAGDVKMPPEVVQMNFTDLRPTGVLGRFFNTIRLLPSKLQRVVLTIFVTLLGAWKGMRIKHLDGTAERVSLLSGVPWKEGGKLFCPIQLFHFKNK